MARLLESIRYVTAQLRHLGPTAVAAYGIAARLEFLVIPLAWGVGSALTALVGFTTSLFSRPYMRVEHDHGRLSSARLRLYHSMFQMFMCTMLTALSTNNLGILWVAVLVPPIMRAR